MEDLIRRRMHEALDVGVPSPDLDRRVLAGVRTRAEAQRPVSWRRQVAAAIAIVIVGLGLGAAVRSMRHSVPKDPANASPSATITSTSQSSGLSTSRFAGTSTLRLVTPSSGWAITPTKILATGDS